MDLDPERIRDDFEEEEGTPEEVELTSEELTAALGWRLPRWMVPPLIAAGVAALALLFWNIGDDIRKAFSGRADTLAVAKAVPVEPEAGLAEGVFIDTAAVVSGTSLEVNLLEAPLDDFYWMLNAEVSETESAALEDTTFWRMLFTPLIPMPELPEPPEEYARGGEIPAAVVMPSAVDTTAFLTAIDSLRGELQSALANLERLQGDSALMQRRLGRLVTAADSLQLAEVRRLANIIEAMDPASAAAMLQERSSEELTYILFRVKPRVAAKIMQNLPPGKRGQIAARIVGR